MFVVLVKAGGLLNTNGNNPCELFPFRHFWITSSAASGYGYRGWLLFHLRSACAFCRFIFQPIAFGFCLLQHRLPAVPSVFLAVDLPGRSVIQNTTWFFSCDQFFSCMNIAGFSAFLFPGIVEETCVSFFFWSSTQPSNERLAFFGLTELSDHSFRPTSDSSVVQTRGSEWSGSLLS